jgi:hypothetical protein
MAPQQQQVLFEFSRGPLEGQFVDAELREAFSMYVTFRLEQFSRWLRLGAELKCVLTRQLSRQVTEETLQYRHDNVVMRITRGRPWALQHGSDVQGAENAFIYFDHTRNPTFLVFGNGEKQPVWRWMFPNEPNATYV